MVTERLGPYVLVRPLAKGGMGEILLAEHSGLSGFAKRVAIKRIRKDLTSNPQYVTLFLNEARVGSFLNHPNIVQLYDFGRASDGPFMILEYVSGGSLLDRCKKGPIPLESPADQVIPVHTISLGGKSGAWTMKEIAQQNEGTHTIVKD